MSSNYIKNFVVISFFSVLVSRLIPHPPNFTSAIALAFYLPALFGYRYIAVALTAFVLSDLLIGIHSLLLFTWGSLLLIGFFSRLFKNSYLRIGGVLCGCIIFYLVSNFGVWLLSDIYTFNLNGLITCYLMALPFLQNSIISSFVISFIIEIIVSIKFFKHFITKINPSY